MLAAVAALVKVPAHGRAHHHHELQQSAMSQAANGGGSTPSQDELATCVALLDEVIETRSFWGCMRALALRELGGAIATGAVVDAQSAFEAEAAQPVLDLSRSLSEALSDANVAGAMRARHVSALARELLALAAGDGSVASGQAPLDGSQKRSLASSTNSTMSVSSKDSSPPRTSRRWMRYFVGAPGTPPL